MAYTLPARTAETVLTSGRNHLQDTPDRELVDFPCMLRSTTSERLYGMDVRL